MKAVYLRGVTSGVRVMGAFINAISHRLSVRVSESHDDLRYVRTVRNGAETISFCTRSWKTLVATLPRRKINAGEVVFSAPLIFLSSFISFNSGRPRTPHCARARVCMTNRISAIEIAPGVFVRQFCRCTLTRVSSSLRFASMPSRQELRKFNKKA